MSMRTPLGLVRGSGSAGSGTRHFWMQRVTAVALVPLTVWLVASLIELVGAGHAVVAAWIGSPIVTAALVLFLVTSLYHLKLGIDSVVDDYVYVPWQKVTIQLANIFGCCLIGLAAVLAVLTISFSG